MSDTFALAAPSFFHGACKADDGLQQLILPPLCFRSIPPVHPTPTRWQLHRFILPRRQTRETVGGGWPKASNTLQSLAWDGVAPASPSSNRSLKRPGGGGYQGATPTSLGSAEMTSVNRAKIQLPSVIGHACTLTETGVLPNSSPLKSPREMKKEFDWHKWCLTSGSDRKWKRQQAAAEREASVRPLLASTGSTIRSVAHQDSQEPRYLPEWVGSHMSNLHCL